MQHFSADATMQKIKKFCPWKIEKNTQKIAHNRPKPFYYTVQPRPMAHSPKLIFHIMKSRNQRSVLLSVSRGHLDSKTCLVI